MHKMLPTVKRLNLSKFLFLFYYVSQGCEVPTGTYLIALVTRTIAGKTKLKLCSGVALKGCLLTSSFGFMVNSSEGVCG